MTECVNIPSIGTNAAWESADIYEIDLLSFFGPLKITFFPLNYLNE